MKRLMRFIAGLLCLIIVAVIVFVLAGGAHKPATKPELGSLKGVSLSPKSYNAVDFSSFMTDVKKYGTVLTWAGDWAALDDPKSAPYTVASLAKQYDYEPVIMVGTHSDKDGKLVANRPLTSAQIKSYSTSAASFAGKYQPKYIGLGVEVNRIYAASPTDFETFAELFSQSYDAIKAASPSTKVFTVFQLEQMKGLNGGLFGKTNNTINNQWGLLKRFPKADVIAFTTYPGLIYGDPSQLPADYFSSLLDQTPKPIAFTEVGWFSTLKIKGWDSSESEQSAFVTRFFELTKTLNPKLVIWPFVYDPPIGAPFKSMGLIYEDGTVKAAAYTWQQAKY